MSQDTPDPKFAHLRPSQKLAGLTPPPPASPGPVSTPEAVRGMILEALLPRAREEAIQDRARLEKCRWWDPPKYDLHWLLLPEAREWTEGEWEVCKSKGMIHAWSIPLAEGSGLDRWLLEMHPKKVFVDGWAGDLFYREGYLMCDQAMLRQAEIRLKEGTRRVEEAKGTTTWIGDQVSTLIPGARVYREWDLEEAQELKRLWPDWLDLDQIWIGCDSDSTSDRMVVLQGTEEQMMKANRETVIAQKAHGLKVGVRVNAWFEQLNRLQAALVMPLALKKQKLLRLPWHA